MKYFLTILLLNLSLAAQSQTDLQSGTNLPTNDQIKEDSIPLSQYADAYAVVAVAAKESVMVLPSACL